jgi:hypothetical protein
VSGKTSLGALLRFGEKVFQTGFAPAVQDTMLLDVSNCAVLVSSMIPASQMHA